MKRLIAFCLAAFAFAFVVCVLAVAKDNYNTSLTVMDGKQERTAIHQHFVITAKDSAGTTFLLAPENRKDMLVPGTYQARIARRDIHVCETKDNGHCRDLKFHVLSAVRK